MMKLTIGKKMGFGFGVLLALVAMLAIVVLFNLANMHRQFAFVIRHDAPVIANARHLLTLVVDMETGQRGFVITGKDEFLEPYEHAVDSFADLLDEEIKLVSDNPAQVKLLKRTGTSLKEWQEKAAAPEIKMRRKVSEASVDARHLQEILSRGEGKALIDEFMTLGHEIRTPMTAILGFAETLLDADESESERLNCILTIQRNGKYLLGIVNDILDLAKIEAGRMAIDLVAIKPWQTLVDVVSLVEVQAEAKGLLLDIDHIGAIPETILCDRARLRQKLINLLANAIKFTKTGTVRVVIRLVQHRDQSCLQFDVIDTGCGMTEKQKATLFQPFAQADTSITRKFGGTGLGLTISKRFAELLGGNITVAKTEPDVGSTFRATVATGSLDGVKMIEDPMSATVVAKRPPTLASVALADLHTFRILLAEDGPDNQRLISLLLKKAGADVTVEENGKLALDAALAARDEGNPFDVILMGMQMPVMDGYEATRQLRQQDYTGPIIALTAHAMQGDRQKCMDAGCDDYATKPIDRTRLLEMVQHYAKTSGVDGKLEAVSDQ